PRGEAREKAAGDSLMVSVRCRDFCGLAARGRSGRVTVDELLRSWLVSRPIPDPCKGHGNVTCESRRVKSKGSLSHPGEPDKGKTGRVNASEPLRRLPDKSAHRNRWLTR